jgi:hypothetical protein
MTEAEWLACRKPMQLLALLGRKADERKRRLFACACCYRIWSLIASEASREAVVAAEQFADGRIDWIELELRERAAKRAIWERFDQAWARSAADACSFVAAERVGNAVNAHQSAGYARMWLVVEQRGTNPERPDFKGISEATEAEEIAQQAAILRDIFGPLPFRPVTFSTEWRTDTAVALARQTYESRDFSAMPILADALQDAGCDNEQILSHCRSEGQHVRGCWVVDLVLGKE